MTNTTESRRKAATKRAFPVDTTVLRRILRLVHCLQKERGAACAFCAGTNNATLRSALEPARFDTDQALNRLRPHTTVSTLTKSLAKVRLTISAKSPTSRQTHFFHKLLVSYNTLIQYVYHEYILRFISFQRALQKKRLGSESSLQSVGNSHLSQRSAHTKQPSMGARVCSHQHLNRFALPPINKKPEHGPPSPLPVYGNAMMSSTPGNKHHRASTLEAIPVNFFADLLNVDLGSDNGAGAYGVLVDLSNEEPVSNSPAAGSPDRNGSSKEDSSKNVLHLVDLLDVFVRLKESAGVERATLSSMLAAGAVESHMLLSDLVLTAENQRKQQEELSHLHPGPLHDLVQDFITMAPQMQQLQSSILAGLDLEQLKTQYDESELWNLVSLYVNKLHSMELLLVEEIEYCTGFEEASTPDQSQVSRLPSNLGTSTFPSKGAFEGAFQSSEQGGSTERTLLENIRTMSPDEVKERLLSTLQTAEIINGGTVTSATKYNEGARDDEKSPMASVAAAAGTDVEILLSELRKAPASKEWEIDLYEVQFKKRIGQGAAGTTYLAKWSGLDVAVKVASISAMGLEGWRKEVQALQKLHHPNIIRLLGSVYHPSPLTFCLVLEYCNAGDLSDAMQKCTPRNFFFHVASGISKGMTYLHHRGVIHRDIKPANVLLDGEVPSGTFTVKVTDFGVSTEGAENDADNTAETGTYRWMSPEVIRHERYTRTADVYSSGIVFWQLLTRETPFANMSQIEAAAAVAMENARPLMPAGVPLPIVELIQQCWAREPSERPSFDTILNRLDEISSRLLSEEEKRWIECPIGHSVYKEIVTEPVATGAKNVDTFQNRLDPPKIQIERKLKVPQKRRGIRALFSRKSINF